MTCSARGREPLTNEPPALEEAVDADEADTGEAAESDVLSVRDVDWFNRTYEVRCGQERQITVVDDEWVDDDGPTYGVLDGGVRIDYGRLYGVPGEAALVAVPCGVGAGTVISNTWVYAVVGSELTQIGQRFHLPRVRFVHGGLETTEFVWEEGDPRCCLSGERTERWVLASSGEEWEPVGGDQLLSSSAGFMANDLGSTR